MPRPYAHHSTKHPQDDLAAANKAAGAAAEAHRREAAEALRKAEAGLKGRIDAAVQEVQQQLAAKTKEYADLSASKGEIVKKANSAISKLKVRRVPVVQGLTSSLEGLSKSGRQANGRGRQGV